MKIVPVTSPAAIQSAPAADKRAAAIAAFNGTPAPTTGQAQETAVQNPNQVSPEELSAIKAPTQDAPETALEAQGEAQPESQPEATQEAIEEEKPKTSQEWARLAKQERQLRAQKQKQDAEFKQREAKLLAREAEAAQKSELNQKGFVSIDSIKADPLGILEKAGVPYDQIADQLINPSKIDPRTQRMLDQMQAKIDSLEKGSTEANERMTRQQQDAYNAAVKQIDTDARTLVKSDPDTYEMIIKTGSSKDVTELITKTYEKDGVLMTVEEAAQEVENYLADEAYKLSEAKKIQKRREEARAKANPVRQTQSSNQAQTSQGQTQPQMKTLTNAASSTRKLSNRERAMAAFKGELK